RAVGLRPHRGVRPERGPVPRGVPVGGAGRDRRAGGRAARTVPARAGKAPAAHPRRRRPGLLRHPGTPRHVRSRPRRRTAQARRPHRGARAVPGGRLDRHRVARDHGGRGPQRSRRGGRRAGHPRPAPPRSPLRARGGGLMLRQSGAAGRRTPGTATRGETVPTVPPASKAARRTAVDVSALLERGRTLAMPVLRAAVDRLAPPMDAVASYHFGWTDVQGRPADGDGGKAVRPALAVLSAEVTGAAPRTGVPGAVAVELVHNFSLLHDDLMDGDEQRRHRDTVWKVHGPAQAILVGDALFALANEMLLELGTAEAGRAARRLRSEERRVGRERQCVW